MSIYDVNGNIITENKTQWDGKVASFIGDSITYGVKTTKTYWLYLKDLLNLSYVYGYGVDGARISNGASPMYNKIESLENNSDIIFLFGGTNDFFAGVELGDWYTVVDGTRTFNTTLSTFKGALNYTLLGLINKFPSKQIVLMTPLHRNTFGSQKTDMQANSKGLYLEDYVNCIKEAGSIFSVNVIDLYHDSGLFPYNSDNASMYFNVSQSDKLHPNAKGHERIAQVIASKMVTIPCIE